MKKFMVLYHAPASALAQVAQATPEQAKAGMDAWNAWAGGAGSSVVDLGQPLSPGMMMKGEGSASASGSEVSGFSIMQAESPVALEKILKGHPHFMMPGASIEVLEYMALPGQ